MRTFGTWSHVGVARRADRMPTVEEKAAMRRYKSFLLVERRVGAISLDASAARCVARGPRCGPGRGPGERVMGRLGLGGTVGDGWCAAGEQYDKGGQL